MLKQIVASLHVSKVESLAKTFTRVGWTGFWLQVVLGSIPLLLMLYVFIFSGNLSGPRAGLPIVEYLSFANLLVLLFTIVWFYRYPGFAKTVADPATRPTESKVVATVWIGVVASSVGILFSMVVMLLEVGQLLFYFLSAPQGGIPAIQTTVAGSASWVSAVDLVSLMSLILTLAAEVIALVLGLWLMFRTTQTADELANPAGR
jgi:hypothetical protein